METTSRVKEKQPLKVSGEMKVILQDGTEIHVPQDPTIEPIVISRGKRKVIIHDHYGQMILSTED